MKKLTLFILLMLCEHLAYAGVDHLLPKPQISSFTSGSGFSLSRPISITAPAISDNDPAVVAELTAIIERNGGSIDPSADASVNISLVSSVPLADFQDEAYHMVIEPAAVTIEAKTLVGAYWAVQTLWQLAEDSGSSLACGNLTDWPAFRIRGYTHDVGRGFLEFDELMNQIEKLSRFKINVFHWHLTENQGWRLESKVYPQLVADSSFDRLPGKFYTIEQAKQLVKYASQHGMTVIPEIDMPGHSKAFRNAMGHSMLSAQGLSEMKEIMTEACATFEGTPWMHIGTDELRNEDQGSINWTSFVPQMVSHIRGLGKKVISWNPGYSYSSSDIDMIHMWSSSGRPLSGVPTIDSRYHYANHFDNYADIVSLYKSNIAEQQKGSDQYAGVIIAFWNDRHLPSDEAIIKQNSVYSSMLAIAERSWLGGGQGYFPTVGTLLRSSDTDFFDWEERFLFHKARFLKDEPIPYVRQSNMKWRITDPFPNSGDLSATFPPETSGIADSYTYNGSTYGAADALGAGVYLRHVWGTTVPGFYSNPQPNNTAYAYTYVYSPSSQTVGLQVEFQNYSRSESDLPPQQGTWDYKGSKIWINDNEITPPTWENTHTTKSTEVTLKNENMTARDPIPVQLNQGWNKVMMKLPVAAFTQTQVRLVKWMFNCVFTTLDGKDAVEGLIYSPDQSLNPAVDDLIAAISSANQAKSGIDQGDNPGQYSAAVVAELNAAIAAAQAVRDNASLSTDDYNSAALALRTATVNFADSWNRPKMSAGAHTYWYKIVATQRDNKCLGFRSNNAALYGETFSSGSTTQQWKFVQLSDGSVSIVNRSSDSYVSPNSSYNTVLKAQAGTQSSGGWSLNFLGNSSFFTLTSGSVQMNQTNSSLSYQIFNWGNGTNTTDTGCLFKFELVAEESVNPLPPAIAAAQSALSGIVIGDNPGEYSQSNVSSLQSVIALGQSLVSSGGSDEDYENMAMMIEAAIELFIESFNVPEPSVPGREYFYSLSSVRDGEKAMTWTADYTYGAAYSGAHTQHWKFVALTDGTFALVNRSSGNALLTNADIASGGNSPVKVFGSQDTFQDDNAWKYQFLHDGVKFALFSDYPSQMHMLNSGSNYKIGDYGINSSTGAINTSDVGCKFTIVFRELVETGLTGIDEIDAGSSSDIFTRGGSLFINALPGTKVTVFNLAGYQVMSTVSNGDLISLSSLQKGFYIVSAGNKRFKVVL